MIPSRAPTMPWVWAVRREPHLPASPMGRSCIYRESAMMATDLEAYNNAQLIHPVALGQESRHRQAPRLQSECRLARVFCGASEADSSQTHQGCWLNPVLGGCQCEVPIALLAVIWGPLSAPRGHCHPQFFSPSWPLHLQTSFKSLSFPGAFSGEKALLIKNPPENPR